MNRTPVAGHISSLRATEQEQKKVSLKDASKKHIDPFTGMEYGEDRWGAQFMMIRWGHSSMMSSSNFFMKRS
jgi:hypothetical protein